LGVLTIPRGCFERLEIEAWPLLGVRLGLYTIFPLPILYAEWQISGGRGETVYCATLIAKYRGGSCNQVGVECQY